MHLRAGGKPLKETGEERTIPHAVVQNDQRRLRGRFRKGGQQELSHRVLHGRVGDKPADGKIDPGPRRGARPLGEGAQQGAHHVEIGRRAADLAVTRQQIGAVFLGQRELPELPLN